MRSMLACWLLVLPLAVSCSPASSSNGPDAGSDASRDGSTSDAGDAATGDGPVVGDAGADASDGAGASRDASTSDAGDAATGDGPVVGDAGADGEAGTTLDGGEGCGCGPERKLCPSPGTAGNAYIVDLCVPASGEPEMWGCGSACACALANVSSFSCVAGACAPATCEAGWGDCNGVASDGCEARLTTDSSNCGTCGHACASGDSCLDGTCGTACTPPLTECALGADGGEVCANLLTSPDHCGGCNVPCAGTCSNGTCTVVTPPCGGTMCTACVPNCVDVCVDTSSDPLNCGMCGQSCETGDYNAACIGGQCTGCPAGTVSASVGCVDPTREVASCGGVACPTGDTCSGSTCVPLSTRLVATGITVDDFAVGAEDLYFVDTGAGTVNAVPLGGGSVTPVATGQASPLHVAVGGTTVYWSNNLGGAIMQASTTGGSPSLAVAASEPTELLVDGTSLYWIGSASGCWMGQSCALNKMTLGSGVTSQIALLASTTGPTYDLQQSSTTLFAEFEVADEINLRAFLKAGGPAPNNGNAPQCPYIATVVVDQLGYAVSDAGTAMTCLETEPTLRTFVASPSFGTWGTHVSSYEDPSHTSLDPRVDSDGTVYFVATPGIRRISPCSDGVVIPEVVIDVPGVTKIALDGNYVYWTDGISLGRVAK